MVRAVCETRMCRHPACTSSHTTAAHETACVFVGLSLKLFVFLLLILLSLILLLLLCGDDENIRRELMDCVCPGRILVGRSNLPLVGTVVTLYC